MKRLLILLAVLSCAGFSAALAEPYWITYEGNDFPENEGWERYYGNWEGPGQGGGIRTLEDGVLTIDSLFDDGVVESAIMERPGGIDPDPGMTFVMEWRLAVDEVYGNGPRPADPIVTVCSGDGWILGIEYGADRIYSGFEPDVSIEYSPGVFHDYQLLSVDLRTYELYMDGLLVHRGSFWEGLPGGFVAWGDGVQGATSLSRWDYVRFGVVPEPATFCLLVLVLALQGRRLSVSRYQ